MTAERILIFGVPIATIIVLHLAGLT